MTHDQTSPRSRRMIFVALAVVILVAIGGWVGFPLMAPLWAAREPAAAATAARTASPASASMQDVALSEQELRSLTIEAIATRSFRPRIVTEGKIATDEDRASPVFSPYAGKIVRILAAPGDIVRQGQVLFTIEATDMVAAQNDFVAAVSNLEKARTALRLAEINERRQCDLYQGRAAPLRDLEQAQADLKGAQADERSAIAAQLAVENRLRILGKSDADLAQLRERGTISSETPILAPTAGLIAQRKIGPGQFVQGGGGDPLFLVDDTAHVWLVAYVREGDTAAIDIGDEVAFQVLSMPGQTFTGTVNHVSSIIDPATRRLFLRASIPNPRGLLKREMFASVTIFTEKGSDWPAVPRRAVIRQGADAHVWVVNEAGRAAIRAIRTGLVQDGFVQVTDGLAAGERVVVQGSLFLDQMVADGR